MPPQSPQPDSAWVRRFQMRIKKKKCTTCGEECVDCPYAKPKSGAGGKRAQAPGSGTGASPSKHAAQDGEGPTKAAPPAN